MEPEAITTGFVATDDGSVLQELEAFLGTLDFELEARQARADGAKSGLLGQSRRKGEFPFAVGQFDGHVERRCRGWVRLNNVGR